MKLTNTVGKLMAVALMVGVVLILCGCHGRPAGTMKTVTLGAQTFQATGAGMVSVEAGKLTFKIKCALCGYEPDPITIDTPVAGKPYVLNWVCPKCGHKQKIVIQLIMPS